MKITVQVLTDGADAPAGLGPIVDSWKSAWKTNYPDIGSVDFEVGSNLKVHDLGGKIPQKLKRIARVRNPDISFVAQPSEFVLGGVETTTHSPDGSNVEKRYPFLWAAGREGVNGFILCPYQKTRPGGQTNRLPNRHARRNIEFIEDWSPAEASGSIRQIIPLKGLQLGSPADLPPAVRFSLLDWADIGEFFADTLALALSGGHRKAARSNLEAFRAKLRRLAESCVQVTSYTQASTLIKDSSRWIQVYNARPESGHWERGEGQFDSIDGRLMFTLDEMARLAPGSRPINFEFWLPQMCSTHPWILEQKQRGFQSKRLRNILVEIAGLCTTRFADDLTELDWLLLQSHSEMVLERLDSKPGIFRIIDMVPPSERRRVAEMGMKSASNVHLSQVLVELNRDDLYFSSHRAYVANWQTDLTAKIRPLPASATLLIPRVPVKLLTSVIGRAACKVVPGDACSKLHLQVLRQIHRYVSGE